MRLFEVHFPSLAWVFSNKDIDHENLYNADKFSSLLAGDIFPSAQF